MVPWLAGTDILSPVEQSCEKCVSSLVTLGRLPSHWFLVTFEVVKSEVDVMVLPLCVCVCVCVCPKFSLHILF